MVIVARALVGLAALAFVIAVVGNLTGFPEISSPEGFSRASTNLTLLAIALVLCFGDGRPASLR